MEHLPLRYAISRAGYLRSLNRGKCSWSNSLRAWWGACNKASSYEHVSWSLLKALASWLSNLVKIRITGTEKCKSSLTHLIEKYIPPFGLIWSKNCSSAAVTKRALSVGMQYLLKIKYCKVNLKFNAYQIAWSFLSNEPAFARSDMKAWITFISFVAPASMPHESWNTNLGLLLKTNSSVILCPPRW